MSTAVRRAAHLPAPHRVPTDAEDLPIDEFEFGDVIGWGRSVPLRRPDPDARMRAVSGEPS